MLFDKAEYINKLYVWKMLCFEMIIDKAVALFKNCGIVLGRSHLNGDSSGMCYEKMCFMKGVKKFVFLDELIISPKLKAKLKMM